MEWNISFYTLNVTNEVTLSLSRDFDDNATVNVSLEVETTRYPPWYESGRIQIPLYSVIFMLAVIGNTLVILTLVQNQRMRTITNLFLLNLAVSDLLLGVLCMPFTLIGALLRDFVFGNLMCKLLPFFQACSVSVGVWTLVAISVERYYAICHPLRSLRWQTLNHAYRLIAAIWIGSLVCMTPIALLSQLQPTKQGKLKCRENWASLDCERAYNLFLDAILLVIPLLVLAITYSLITRTLCKGMRSEKSKDTYEQNAVKVYVNLNGRCSTRRSTWNRQYSSRHKLEPNWSEDSSSPPMMGSRRLVTGLRRTNAERSLMNKKRVIKMLFAVVLEFFICWTPLYIINTIALFDASIIYNSIGYTGIGIFQLLAFTSSCCNPITYCFMNSSFRKSFVNLFRCFKKFRNTGNYALTGSDINMETKWTHNRNSEQA